MRVPEFSIFIKSRIMNNVDVDCCSWKQMFSAIQKIREITVSKRCALHPTVMFSVSADA